MSSYRCTACGYSYDESAGHPREGFPPGTPWSHVPDDWACPDCGVRDKVDFEPLSAGQADEPYAARGPDEPDAARGPDRPRGPHVAGRPDEQRARSEAG